MTKQQSDRLKTLWDTHSKTWRDPLQIAGFGGHPLKVQPELLEYKVSGEWWDLLAELNVMLLVSREYEHLLIELSCRNGTPQISFMPVPHPSGIAYDSVSETVHLACTRNPNMILDMKPVNGFLQRSDANPPSCFAMPLIPVRSRFYPGSLYIHDLAMIGGILYANAVGHNAVVRLADDESFQRVWWPSCIEGSAGPDFSQNYLQLNSIAAGETLDSSWFSASTDRISARRPGHLNFAVNRRGVLFSGLSRLPEIRGLTRPHSARQYQGAVWVDNSGYGELLRLTSGRPETVCQLPGWTRGLCFKDNIAFVGTSRVIPRYSNYAPGLDANRSICGIHAIDLCSGRTIGSIVWPTGNQIFALECLPVDLCVGLPCRVGKKHSKSSVTALFYSFLTEEMR